MKRFQDFSNILIGSTPQFTGCFQHTALIWIPCFVILISSIYVFLRNRKLKTDPLPWTWLNVTKLVSTRKSAFLFWIHIRSLLKTFSFSFATFFFVFRSFAVHFVAFGSLNWYGRWSTNRAYIQWIMSAPFV